eukprot:7391215-Prymnesium_polylepis.1
MSAERAALERRERHEFCRLLGEGDVVRGLDLLLDREAAAARRHQQQCGGGAEGDKAGCRTSARRRREQRLRQAMRTGASDTRGGHGGGGCGVDGGQTELNTASLVSQREEGDWLALGERRAAAATVFEAKDRDAHGPARVLRCGADSVGERRRWQPQGPGPGQEQQLATAPAVPKLLEAQ